jgi:cytochrome c peroxidase
MFATASVVVVGIAAAPASARVATTIAPLSSLNVPTPVNIDKFIRDNLSAVKLGKALFWDMQAGSDGRVACASCHFSAGTDSRSRNQLNPRGGGFNFSGKGANAQFDVGDFPFHKLADPTDRGSRVLADTSNVAGSAGVVPATFGGTSDGSSMDLLTWNSAIDPDFNVGGVNVRRSSGRRTPSVINAVFNYRNLWDGRAQNDFNGVSPFGSRDVNARVGKVNASGGVDQVRISLPNSSLASVSVGPPTDKTLMSAQGRILADVGKKLLSLKPLGEQQVDPSDSVLGADVSASGRGLDTTYAGLIRQAFQPVWWNSGATVSARNGRSYPLMSYNFSLYWGLAIQAYMATLVSDQTPVDLFLLGDRSALSPSAQAGMRIFNTDGECSSCHTGAAMTSASVDSVNKNGLIDKEDPTGDTGFMNTGVTPTANDIGLGGNDPFGNPFSERRLAAATAAPGQPADTVDGAFKVPPLRNVALQAPFFHNGGELTLRQVVDFYARGGDVPNRELKPITAGDTSLGLNEQERQALVSFLESLTDPRVEKQAAPFDHPQLFVASGAKANPDSSLVLDGAGRAVDCWIPIPATGISGGDPLPRFPDLKGPCATPPPLQQGAPAGPASAGGAPPAPANTATPTLHRHKPLALAALRARRQYRLRDVRARGLTFRLGLPVGTASADVAIRRLGSRVPIYARAQPTPAGARRFRLAVRPRRISPGRYSITVTPREADRTPGQTAERSFSIVR